MSHVCPNGSGGTFEANSVVLVKLRVFGSEGGLDQLLRHLFEFERYGIIGTVGAVKDFAVPVGNGGSLAVAAQQRVRVGDIA